jgi:hypothetical protein
LDLEFAGDQLRVEKEAQSVAIGSGVRLNGRTETLAAGTIRLREIELPIHGDSL